MHAKGRRGGFSLLELLAVVTILGIIAVVTIPRIAASTSTAKTNVHLQNVSELNSAIERYYFDTGQFPSVDMNELSGFLPDGLPKDPRTNPPSDYLMDATTNRVPKT
ncbi:MAG: prepilin-type N-terminal cleavage/methylation domain-containing protein [Planctomycetota bacterium]